jgi:hypothetical protein
MCCKQCCNWTDASAPKAMTLAKQGKDTSAMLMVVPANANNDTSAVHARTPAHHRQDGSSVTTVAASLLGKHQRDKKDDASVRIKTPVQFWQ